MRACRVVNALLLLQAACAFSFFICACVVAGTPNAGSNAMLSAMGNFVLLALVAKAVNMGTDATLSGICLGAGAVTALSNFMTAIYWGQLSECEKAEIAIEQFVCENKPAYGAVSAFATLLFLLQSGTCALLWLWKDSLLQYSQGPMEYDDLSASPSSSASTSSHQLYE